MSVNVGGYITYSSLRVTEENQPFFDSQSQENIIIVGIVGYWIAVRDRGFPVFLVTDHHAPSVKHGFESVSGPWFMFQSTCDIRNDIE